jgi:hypothetical protein
MSASTAGLGESPRPRLGLQERLESSRFGRWLITGFLVVTLAGILVSNLPAGAVERAASKVTGPYDVATGLDQWWAMFAPYPRSEILYLEARILRADGQVSMWRPPTDGALVGAYRDAHWRKFVEHAVPRPGNPDSWPQLWRPLALYIARLERAHGSRPVQVTLIKRSAEILPLKQSRADHTPFEQQGYYTLRLP